MATTSKFTDSFFIIPIKTYDERTLRQALEIEESTNIRIEEEWVQGSVRLPADCLSNMTWQDAFTPGRSIEEVREEGFDCTLIYTDMYGEFVCTWPRKKFEDKLNEFMAKQPKKEEEEDLEL